MNDPLGLTPDQRKASDRVVRSTAVLRWIADRWTSDPGQHLNPAGVAAIPPITRSTPPPPPPPASGARMPPLAPPVGARMQILDLDDPDVRAMADRNHRPEEMWYVNGGLIAVRCETCRQPWPCPTRSALRAKP